jgi:hypothetical protein
MKWSKRCAGWPNGNLDRDLALRAAGFRRVLRIGEALIWDQPDRVVAVVLAARAEGRGGGVM